MTKKSSGLLFPYLNYIENVNEFPDGVRNFCFYPGMLFKSREKWWQDSGERPTGHEGVDICYYTDNSGKEHKFTSQTSVPVVAQGRLFAFCRDFLGHSVFLEHGKNTSLRFLSVYAHIKPLEHLTVGQELQAGEVVGMIANTAGRKNRMDAHVHISLMKIPQTVAADMLDWNFICYSDKVELVDPLSMIQCESVIFKTKKTWKDEEGARI